MDRKTLADIFQEIIEKFAEMNPTNLDGLEIERKCCDSVNDLSELQLGIYGA